MSPIDRFHRVSDVSPMEETQHVHVRDVSQKSRIYSISSKSVDKKEALDQMYVHVSHNITIICMLVIYTVIINDLMVL